MEFEIIRDNILEKAKRHVRFLRNFIDRNNLHNFYLAGGCFGEEVNDYDIFLTSTTDPFYVMVDTPIYSSVNAYTYKYDDKLIQICKYTKPTLSELIDSFDFSNCQVGVHYHDNGISTQDVYFTKDFIKFLVTRIPEYTGSDYPISSLLRLSKYTKRYNIPKSTVANLVVSILKDIVSRGFYDYKDFKNQLEAIDLNYDFSENKDVLELFHLLGRDTNH